MASEPQLVLVGGYAPAAQPGILFCTFDSAHGVLTKRGAASGITNPSFLALHPNGEWLFSVSETSAADGAPGGVAALRLARTTGTFTLTNTQPSGGDWPCHLCLDVSGRWLIVSNYGSGSVRVFPIGADGALGEATDHVQHQGRGPNAQRQEGPHAHSATPMPDGEQLLVADLGTDQLMMYELNADDGTLARTGAVIVPAGAGPRHITFSADGRQLFVATELGNTVVRYRYDAANGTFAIQQEISTVPTDAPTSYVADIHLSPDDTRLYVSNRGHNSIATYTIGPDGALALAGVTPCGGDWPRNFAVSPDGRWLLVANQYSGDIAVLPIDANGLPGPAIAQIPVPDASFVQFI